MTTEAQREQAERRRVFENDQRLRNQQGGSAYIDHYMQEAGGRFSAHAAAHVVGSTAVPIYPAAAAHQSDPVGLEPPLGFDNPELELRPEVQGNSGDADAPSTPCGVEPAPPSSSGDPAGVHFPSPPGTSSSDVNAGSPPYRRVR
jgi:hypothetical protein